MGDEYIESLFYCSSCKSYTLEIYVDHFLGEESQSIEGPFSKEKGDSWVTAMSKCQTPHDKKCRCPAHREHFGSGLD